MSSRRPGPLVDRWSLWVVRAVWVAVAPLVGAAIGGALADRSRPVQVVGTASAWIAWFAVLVALLVPACAGLTAIRTIAPGTILVSIAAALGGASTVQIVVALAASVITTLLVMSAPVGQAFVQGGAYGDETRLPLRPPGPLLLGPIPVLWLATATAVIAAPLLLAARAWGPGVPVAVAAVALAVLVVPRLHRLALRWLVFVPAGVVIHDRLVLAETAMFPGRRITSLDLAPATTEAADLTGTALGPAIEIGLAGTETVVLAPTRTAPGGTALHVRSVLVSPTRPGRTVAEAAGRGLRTARRTKRSGGDAAAEDH